MENSKDNMGENASSSAGQNAQTKVSQQNPLAIPGAIIFAGLLIAAAVFYGGNGNTGNTGNNNANQPAAQNQGSGQTVSLDKMLPITSSDHILGDASAPVKLVEYSDFECPFCKRYHDVVKQVVAEYGQSGKVAIVYRHFPLDSLHPKARHEAAASECANELGGNDKFWAFADRIFDITPSNNGLDPNQLPEIAKYIGVDVNKFNTCLSTADEKYKSLMDGTIANAIATGGQGTPWSIVVAKNGTKYPINGALPYDQVKAVIDQALSQN